MHTLARAVVIAVTILSSGCSSDRPAPSPTAPSAPATVQSLAISGSAAFTSPQQSSQLSAVASLSDGTTQNVTDRAVWQSSNAAVATISGTGLVTTVGFGLVDVTATYQERSALVTVSVAAPCTFALSETSVTFDRSGGERVVQVTAGADCAWNAASDAPWLGVLDAGPGRGSGTLRYSVAPLGTSGARTGTIRIGTAALTVRQDDSAPPPPAFQYFVSPTSRDVPSGGGSYSLTVSTNRPDARWTATSQESWIRVLTGESSSGQDVVTYSVSPNTSTTSREGRITVAGLSGLNPPAVHTIRQAGRP